MKDGSDGITGCREDGETLLPLPSPTDNGPGGCLGLKDPDKPSPEAISSWGDFESFNEFTPQPEQPRCKNGPLDESKFVAAMADGEDHTDQTDGDYQWDAFNLGHENRQECERIFRLSFPAVPVEDTNEDVKSLAELLTTPNENMSNLIRTRLWLECDPSWQSADGKSTKSGCEWQNTKGCRDLTKLLGSTPQNLSVDRRKSRDALTDPEQFYVNESTPPAGNKYLIQTKLDVAPGSTSGHIFSYQLVLKKSQSDAPLPFLTFSGKRSFF